MEFTEALRAAAAAAGIFSDEISSLLIVIVTVSMALTPPASALAGLLMQEQEETTEELEEDFAGAGADVLMIGFSRFGQIASQILLAGGREVTIIDHSAARVRQALREQGLDFVLVCKPDSHPTTVEWLQMLQRSGDVQELTVRRSRGLKIYLDCYRWAHAVPLRDGEDALSVDWCELITTDEAGKTLYRNSFASSLPVSADNVREIVAAGRTRWKIENENNNTLKTKGYRFEHNFGHGQQHLSATLASMGVAATGWPGGRGRQTVKQVPWFGMLLTCKRPCINSTSWRAMVVPSPVPPKRRVVLASACAKGANTRLNCSAVMPMPVSCTCTCSHCSGPWRTCNVTLPMAVNLMALESRLSSTW